MLSDFHVSLFCFQNPSTCLQLPRKQDGRSLCILPTVGEKPPLPWPLDPFRGLTREILLDSLSHSSLLPKGGGVACVMNLGEGTDQVQLKPLGLSLLSLLKPASLKDTSNCRATH